MNNINCRFSTAANTNLAIKNHRANLWNGFAKKRLLQTGNVFINSYGYQSEIPFGGYKMSGIGREHGAEAMHEYTQIKSITVGMERFQSRFDI